MLGVHCLKDEKTQSSREGERQHMDYFSKKSPKQEPLI